jgi:hypothetical protein
MGNSQPQGSYPHTGQHKQNKRTRTSMPQVGFKLMIPAFDWVKTAHALDRAATVISSILLSTTKYYILSFFKYRWVG